MNPDRLTGMLFNYFKKLEMSKNIEELQITQEDIQECLPLKKKLKSAQGFQEEDWCHLDRRQEAETSINNEGDVGDEDERGEEGMNQLNQTQSTAAHTEK